MITAENESMPQVVPHPHNCLTDPQREVPAQKEKYCTLVFLISVTNHPSFIQPLKIHNWPNCADLSLPKQE